jgi:hypothetical protein
MDGILKMNDKDVSILILSCDAFADVWEPFFILKERYWGNCQYKTYITTETVDCPYATTIKHDYPLSQWTKRIRESILEIPTKYIIILDGDMFIRSQVDSARIDYCVDNMDDAIITFSFEKEYAATLPSKFNDFRLKPNKSPYLNSCQPSIWDREKLIDRLLVDMNPWSWENSIVDSIYKHYVNSGEYIIDYGYYNRWFGVRKGKWVKEDVVPLFAKENIYVDYDKRGFYGE